MSNQEFTGIFNTALPSISQTQGQFLQLNTLPIPLVATDSDLNLTLENMNQANASTLLLTVDGMTADRSIRLGSDTASNARSLLSILNLKDISESVLLNMQTTSANQSGFSLSIGNSDGTATNVLCNNGTSAVLVETEAGTANGNILVLVFPLNVTAGSEAINFEVLKTAST